MSKQEIDWSKVKVPVGATHYLPGRHHPWYRKDGGVWMFWTGFVWGRADPNEAEKKAMIKRPKEWSGEGLPPVGAACEMRDDDDSWCKATVIAHGIDRGIPTAVGQADDKLLWCQTRIDCRPIRTPEQIADDEALADIERLYSEGGPAAVYDAGYRKANTSQQGAAEISSDIKQANLNLLADKVLAVSAARRLTAGGNAEVSLHGLIELVALAKELKQ